MTCWSGPPQVSVGAPASLPVRLIECAAGLLQRAGERRGDGAIASAGCVTPRDVSEQGGTRAFKVGQLRACLVPVGFDLRELPGGGQAPDLRRFLRSRQFLMQGRRRGLRLRWRARVQQAVRLLQPPAWAEPRACHPMPAGPSSSGPPRGPTAPTPPRRRSSPRQSPAVPGCAGAHRNGARKATTSRRRPAAAR